MLSTLFYIAKKKTKSIYTEEECSTVYYIYTIYIERERDRERGRETQGCTERERDSERKRQHRDIHRERA